MERPFDILSIDGGGIRGIIPATVLAELERRTGRRIAELFDLITGRGGPGAGGRSLRPALVAAAALVGRRPGEPALAHTRSAS